MSAVLYKNVNGTVNYDFESQEYMLIKISFSSINFRARPIFLYPKSII